MGARDGVEVESHLTAQVRLRTSDPEPDSGAIEPSR